MSDTDVEVAPDLQAGVTDEDDEPKTEPKVEEEDAEKGKGPELVTEETPEDEPKEEPKAETESTQQAWDKERQARDQAHAADRRELNTQLEVLKKAQTESSETVLALRERLDAAEKKAVEEPESDVLSEEADVDEIVKVLNSQKTASKDLATEIATLKQHISDRDTAETERQEVAKKAAAEASVKADLETLKAKYGEQYSAEAQKRAKKYFLDQGFDDTEENAPPDIALKLALDKFFQEVKGEDPSRKPVTPESPSVPLDTGTGGGSTASPRRPETDAQAQAKMRKEGHKI